MLASRRSITCWAATIMGDRSSPGSASTRRGTRTTGARATSGGIEVEFEGKASHTSQPERGVNALTHLGRLLAAVERQDAALRRSAPHPLLSYGSLQPVLAAFVEPALALARDRQGGGAFIRVIARAYAEKNDGLRKFLSEQYGHVPREFARAIAECVPHLDKEQLYWRLDFLSGALTYAMSDFGLIKRPPGVSEIAHRKRAAEELIRFTSAGIQS